MLALAGIQSIAVRGVSHTAHKQGDQARPGDVEGVAEGSPAWVEDLVPCLPYLSPSMVS